MTVSSELWQANQDLAQACLEHPLYKALPMVHFTGKMPTMWDLFPGSLARAYSIAAAKATDCEGLVPSMP